MKKKLLIEGMSWGSCVRRVRGTLDNIEGVTVEDVKIGYAIINVADDVRDEDLSEAIYDGGYDVTEIENI